MSRIHFLIGVCVFGLADAVVAQQATVPKPDSVKVAAVQVSGYDKGELPRQDFDPSGKLVPYIDRAGREGAQLVVFPEYVLGHTDVPGDVTQPISAAARANSIYVIVGCWEQSGDGTFANVALVFGRNGEIVGRYRKTHPAIDHFDGDDPWKRPPAGKSRRWMLENDPEWIMQAGEDLPVFDLDFGRVGIMTCYDGWFPEPPRVLSLRGAELIVWINGRRGTVEDFIVRSIMFQSHVAMITSNQAYGGGTMIGDGRSRILAQSPARQESYITATINLARVRHMRSTSRNFAQRRPDLYGELVRQDLTQNATAE
ncbi:carbon-nitrogen hydrolase family protein [Rhodopirellula sp. JC639]|uniref:carbon-nitrogen hydrolase family protein n=1 Tax=Stieleria mannarensis TaxID=2755585 RepID=UPI001600F8A9|nr:carbon-nitrogen hydrolase family protein [Rhodopirellula sp. JC639]